MADEQYPNRTVTIIPTAPSGDPDGAKTPPPPPGFQAVGAAPPPGFQVVPPDPPKGFSLVQQALKPFTTYFPTEARIAKESAGTVKQGLSDLVPQALGGPQGKTASGLWDVATGAARYAGAPIEAGLETFVGKPIEENTGIPSEWTKFAAGLAIPYYGLRGSPAATTAKKIFTPENVSPQAQEAAGIIRGTQGEAARSTASSMDAIKPYHPIVNALSEPERMDFFKYMEGRSQGVKIDPRLQPIADELKSGFEKRRMDLQSLDSKAEMNFVQDYFPHMWKDPKKAQDFLSQFGGREGSGRNLKARTIPTIEDGINAGLELKTTNPLDAYQAYITNMDRFIATERAFEKGREVGSVKYFTPGKQPAGWVEVKSRLGTKIAKWTTEGKEEMLHNNPPEAIAILKQAYAPEDWARIYNNFTSRGATELGSEFGSLYEAARMSSNAVTALELSMSGYHALTMAQEGIVNEVARSIQQGARGSLLKSAATLVKAPVAWLTLPLKGSKVQKVYLNSTPGSKEMRDVVDILTQAGARLVGRAHAADLGSSAAGSFFDAWKKGSLKTELKADWKDFSGRPIKTTASAVARNVGRAMDTVMQPLFQTYIPKLKAGAVYENMADWLKANPKATKPEQLAMARQIVDSIDNRFGEMIQDNIFWNKMLKQSAIVAMRSYSWNLGTVREIAGGATDVLAGKGLTQRAAYNIALPIVYGMTGAIYQYINTGEGPQNVQDYIAPRTGGTDPRSGLPERITPPGYMKDVFGWASDPRQEAINKIATAPRLAGEMLFKGTDWRGDPIAPPGDPSQPLPDNVPTWLKAYFEHVAEAMGPISIKNTAKGAKRGSNLSTFERVLGIQPGGMAKTDPKGFELMMQKINERKWKNKLRHDQTQQNQYGGTVE